MSRKVNLETWTVEDYAFWKTTGKKIAYRNLIISIPNLLLAFAIWIMWSIIATQMKEAGYDFGMLTNNLGPDELRQRLNDINTLYYTLPAIAGLVGATLRIPNSFLIALCGGRTVVFVTSVLLMIPCVGAALSLRDLHTPYLTFAIFAALSGFGGGAFASSMSNISYFFPKRMQGTALGLNAGIGNLGVGVMQKIIPLVVGLYLFSALDGTGSVVKTTALAGIQNSGWVWVPCLVLGAVLAYAGMHNVITGTPQLCGALLGILRCLYLTGLGLVGGGLGAFLLTQWHINMWIVLPLVIVVTVMLMKWATPPAIQVNLNRQFSIFKEKHNWIMTIIYVMTFGSFIGYSAAFPKLCQDVFVYSDPMNPTYVNPNAPNFLLWVFLGPMLGALVRPVGGWLSDKMGSGSRVTHWSTILQVLSALGVAFFIIQAKESATPEVYWWPFFVLFLLLFIGSGIGNGSTFRTISAMFSSEKAGPVLGWSSAIGAYGAFIIPNVFGEQIKAGHPEYALYGFAVYYVVCLMLNWWYYLGPKREMEKP